MDIIIIRIWIVFLELKDKDKEKEKFYIENKQAEEEIKEERISEFKALELENEQTDISLAY